MRPSGKGGAGSDKQEGAESLGAKADYKGPSAARCKRERQRERQDARHSMWGGARCRERKSAEMEYGEVARLVESC